MLHFGFVLVSIVAFVLTCSLECQAGAHPGLRVAMCQIRVEDGDLAGNMCRAEEAVRQAAAQGADLICLPEAADFGWLYQEARRDAFPISGKYTDFIEKLARELKVWISVGCLEKDGDKVYNSAVIIDRRGKIALKHRKINTLPNLTKHLYDAGKAGDVRTVDTEFGRIGLTICADNFSIKNPKKAANMGAWLLIAPHGFAAKKGNLRRNSQEYQEHIRSVAKQTGMWVIGTDTCMGRVAGGAWKGWLHSGCSTIAKPDGEAAAVGRFLYPDLVICDIPAAS